MSSARPPAGTKRRRFTSIPGFSDQPGFPRLGKVRLGVRSTSTTGKEFPKEVDYFVLDPDDALQPHYREELLRMFHEQFGERPTTIEGIMFVSADREEAFEQSLNWYGQNKLLCHGNGEEAERLNRESGQWERRANCANSGQCPEWNSEKCKMVTKLRFVIPSVSMAGFFQLDTGSKYSSANLRNGINLLEALFQRIHGIPLTLTRAPQVIEHEGKANTHYIVSLWAPNVNLDGVKQLAAQSMLALPEPTEPLVVDDEEIPEDIIPASDQQAPPDPELMKQIDTGFDLLEIKAAERLVRKNKYRGREAQLLEDLRSEYRKKNAPEVPA